MNIYEEPRLTTYELYEYFESLKLTLTHESVCDACILSRNKRPVTVVVPDAWGNTRYDKHINAFELDESDWAQAFYRLCKKSPFKKNTPLAHQVSLWAEAEFKRRRIDRTEAMVMSVLEELPQLSGPGEVKLLAGPGGEGGAARMTSREIAELIDKQHKHVLRDIDNLLISLGPDLGRGISEAYEGDSSNGYRYFVLDRDSTYCLIAGYDATARMKIIKRWQTLEEQARIGLAKMAKEALQQTFASLKQGVTRLSEGA